MVNYRYRDSCIVNKEAKILYKKFKQKISRMITLQLFFFTFWLHQYYFRRRYIAKNKENFLIHEFLDMQVSLCLGNQTHSVTNSVRLQSVTLQRNSITKVFFTLSLSPPPPLSLPLSLSLTDLLLLPKV